jgi:hypothetical protein
MAGQKLIKRLSSDEIVQSVGGKMTEKLFGHNQSDNIQSFVLAVEQVLQNGGNVQDIVTRAEDTCLKLLVENITLLEEEINLFQSIQTHPDPETSLQALEPLEFLEDQFFQE